MRKVKWGKQEGTHVVLGFRKFVGSCLCHFKPLCLSHSLQLCVLLLSSAWFLTETTRQVSCEDVSLSFDWVLAPCNHGYVPLCWTLCPVNSAALVLAVVLRTALSCRIPLKFDFGLGLFHDTGLPVQEPTRWERMAISGYCRKTAMCPCYFGSLGRRRREKSMKSPASHHSVTELWLSLSSPWKLWSHLQNVHGKQCWGRKV